MDRHAKGGARSGGLAEALASAGALADAVRSGGDGGGGGSGNVDEGGGPRESGEKQHRKHNRHDRDRDRGRDRDGEHKRDRDRDREHRRDRERRRDRDGDRDRDRHSGRHHKHDRERHREHRRGDDDERRRTKGHGERGGERGERQAHRERGERKGHRDHRRHRDHERRSRREEGRSDEHARGGDRADRGGRAGEEPRAGPNAEAAGLQPATQPSPQPAPQLAVGGSSAAADACAAVLDQYPPLREELGALLGSIDSGEAADVSGVADAGVRGALEALFGALGLARGSDGWYRPEGAPSAMGAVAGVLDDGGIGGGDAEDDGPAVGPIGPAMPPGSGAGPIGPAMPPAGPAAIGPAAMPPPRVGPAMPTPEEMTAAAQAVAAAESDSDSDSDMVGPPPPGIVKEVSQASKADKAGAVDSVLAADGMHPGDAYRALGVEAGASAAEVKKRYWRLSLLVHPDKNDHPRAKDAFDIVNAAKHVLTDASQRAALDEKLADAELMAEVAADVGARLKAAQWRRATGAAPHEGDEDLLSGGVDRTKQREGWMTELPPERKAPSGAAPGVPAMPSSQTAFSSRGVSSRGDTTAWTDTPREREARAAGLLLEGVSLAKLTDAGARSAAMERKRTSETAELVDGFNASKRSKSMLDEHRERMAKGAGQGAPGTADRPAWASNHPWRPWDRDRDLEIKPAGQTAEGAAKSAQASLSGRFGAGKGPRTFL